MRRAYISAHIDLHESFQHARDWAGHDSVTTILGCSTRAITESPWLKDPGWPIGTTGNRHSRYTARAQSGIVIAWCLMLDEVLEIEDDADLDGLIVVRGYEDHAPWITAHDVELLGGKAVPRVPEASAAIKAMVDGISLLAVRNQGLVDSRERSMAVQALTYMRNHGHALIPEQLAVEALRQKWPGTSPIEFAGLARQLNAGKQLRFQERLNQSVLAEWAST